MKWLKFFLLAWLIAPLPAHAAVITVAPGGSVQEALDRAQPGDTVHLRPGGYRERVKFTHGGAYARPVTLEGEPGAILDGSEAVTLDWQPASDVAPGVWRARVPFPVFTLTADGKIVTMLREDRVRPGKAKDPAWEWPNIFRNGVGPSGWSGVKALALYLPAKKEILLRFQGDRDPRSVPITIAPRAPVVRIDGTDRCVVRGLTLRNAAYGVRIEHSLGSVVEQCVIGPIDYGLWIDRGADRCTVRFNEMFMNPYAGADPHQRPGSWDNWQAHKTGGHYDRYGVEIANSIGGHEIHDNDIHDHWDGIEDRGEPGENRGLRIHHNRIFNVSDDGLEPNGAEEDCQWHDNLVQRCICGFRIKDPLAGPLYAYRNIFLDNGEDFRNYMDYPARPAAVYVYHNTCTSSGGISSNKVNGIGTPNYHYLNNLFWCRYWVSNYRSTEPNWHGDYNVYVRRDKDSRWPRGRALATRLKLDGHSLWAEGDPGFTALDKGDLSLRPESPARGRGADLSRLLGKPLPGCEPGYFTGSAPDAGALAFGQPMPHLPRKPGEVKAPGAGLWPPDEKAEKGASRGGSVIAYPLKPAPGGRYLVDQHNHPVLVVGDTAWSLIVALDENSIRQYLDDRQARGFNAILVNLIEHKFAPRPPLTESGLAPFMAPGDFTRPNDKYFNFAKSVVAEAGRRGIAIWLVPGYLGGGGGNEGWFRDMRKQGPGVLRAYGRYVGRRFTDCPNIIWVMGGDYTPKPPDQWTLDELAAGIREGGSEQLITAHGARGNAAAQAFPGRNWMGINTVYSDAWRFPQALLAEYHRSPVQPFVMLENIYENENKATPELIRAQAYWTILGGGCGHFFGNNPIWHFDGPGLFPVPETWREALGSQGSCDMARMRQAFAGRDWFKLEPDPGQPAVIEERGSAPGRVATAITPDGRLAMSYLVASSKESREVTVNLGRFSGPVDAQWYDPATGEAQPCAGSPFPNRGRHILKGPGRNGAKVNDWLLILEVRP